MSAGSPTASRAREPRAAGQRGAVAPARSRRVARGDHRGHALRDATRLRHDREPRGIGRTVVRPAAAVLDLERQPRERGSVRHAVEAGPALRLERAAGRDDRAGHGRGRDGRRSASTSASRAPRPKTSASQLAMRELERTHAFDREWLLIDLPTGTGYVNYAAVSVLEMLSRGNCATVAMQYAARPSPLSLDRVGEGHRQARLLIDAISERLRRMPDNVPAQGRAVRREPRRVDEPGRVLGPGHAWPRSTPGIDYAIWIGTPHFSQWKEQVLRDERADVASELIGVFNDIDEWEATRPSSASSMRYVMITHHNDGVARFGPGLIDPGTGVARRSAATLARDPEGHALDADHDVLSGARRHEELGERRSRRVRGDRPRLPSRPPSVLPRGPRYQGHRRSDAATREVARGPGTRAKRVGEASRHGRHESRGVIGRRRGCARTPSARTR